MRYIMLALSIIASFNGAHSQNATTTKIALGEHSDVLIFWIISLPAVMGEHKFWVETLK